MSEGFDWGKLIIHDDAMIGEIPQPATKTSTYIDLPILPGPDRTAYVAPPPPEPSLLTKILKRMFGSALARILWFMVSPIIFSPTTAWKGVVMVATFISSFGGEEAADMKNRVKKVMKDAPLPVAEPAIPNDPKPGILGQLEAKVAAKTIDPIKEKAKSVKDEAVRKAEDLKETAVEVKEDAVEKVDEVKGEVTQKAGEVKDSIEKLAKGGQPVQPGAAPAGSGIRQGLGSLDNSLRNIAPNQPGKTQAPQFNGRCPNCGKPMRIAKIWHGMHACSRCGESFDADDARRLGTPFLPGGFQ